MNENYRIGKGNLHIAFPNKTILDTYVMCVGCNNCNYSAVNNTLCLYADKKESLLKAVLDFKIYTIFVVNILKSIKSNAVSYMEKLYTILSEVQNELERSL